MREESRNLKWVRESVNIFGRFYILNRLMIRALHPRGRVGDWVQHTVKEKRSVSPILVLEFKGKLLRNGEVVTFFERANEFWGKLKERLINRKIKVSDVPSEIERFLGWWFL